MPKQAQELFESIDELSKMVRKQYQGYMNYFEYRKK